MISLSSEMTDAKGRRASRGWIFVHRGCSICISLARRFRPILEKRGFGLAALQDPRVAALLGLPPDKSLQELRVVTTDGQVFGGSKAVVFLARQVCWSWLLYAAAKLPGVPRILDATYRWGAKRRRCVSGNCSVSRENHIGKSLGHTKGEPK
jgi:predicted DCC family thiol-disulfide oxidoreductase YuxK